MSIENNLASIAKSLESIAASLANRGNNLTPVSAPVQATDRVAPVVAPVAAAPVVTVPVATPILAPAVALPLTPVGAASSGTAPFTDSKGLITYVMDSYKTLGPEKGAKIQGVLVSLGYQNINDVKPESYAALYLGVEGLK